MVTFWHLVAKHATSVTVSVIKMRVDSLHPFPGLRGMLPRNFTDKSWQAVRTDGELMWILKNGSLGTAMASFVPLVLTEEEAWHVILYVRSFGR